MTLTANHVALFYKYASPEPNTGCWLWTGPIDGGPHGRPRLGSGKRHIAARVAWIIYRGPIPVGFLVCHHCDNGMCVNPDHLFLGTHADNTADMLAKGRWSKRSGSLNTRARLRDEDVEVLRWLVANGIPARLLAEPFGISRGHAQTIAHGKSWISRPPRADAMLGARG